MSQPQEQPQNGPAQLPTATQQPVSPTLPAGWQQLNSDTANQYLYKSFPVSSLAAGLKLVTAAAGLAIKQKLDRTTHLSLDGYAVTISLNSPADHPLNGSHFALAKLLGSLPASNAP